MGVQERPASAPQDTTWAPNYRIIGNGTFVETISAVSQLVFAFAGTPAFFPIISEMRDPRYYTRALLICQGTVVAVYITIGCVVYCYCGSYIASPALGSAGVLMKKVCYGFALPGLLVTTMLVVHVGLPGALNIHALCLTHNRSASGQIYLCDYPAWLASPHSKHNHPLGHLAYLHLRHCGDRLHYRECDPGL